MNLASLSLVPPSEPQSCEIIWRCPHLLGVPVQSLVSGYGQSKVVPDQPNPHI